MSKYFLEDGPMYRAVVQMNAANGKVETQYIGPYSKPSYAKGQVTYHRNHVWKKDFVDGWIEKADNWTRAD